METIGIGINFKGEISYPVTVREIASLHSIKYIVFI